VNSEMDLLGQGIADDFRGVNLSYEEFFKLMSLKTKEAEDLQLSSNQLNRLA